MAPSYNLASSAWTVSRLAFLPSMFSFEWLVLAYLAVMVMAAVLRPAGRTSAVTAGIASMTAVLAVVAFAPPGVRLALPPVYLVIGYWIPALMIDGAGTVHPTRLEIWLTRTDAGPRRRVAALPGVVLTVSEVAYLLCYPFVPLMCALAWHAGGRAVMPHFWINVLLAGFVSYATLPWLVSRPPRVVFTPAPVAGVAAVNVAVLGRVSHGWNTFPSGHVAVSTAAAWSLWLVWPEAGVAAGVVALAIATGAVSGGYHYAADVAAAWVAVALAAVITR